MKKLNTITGAFFLLLSVGAYIVACGMVARLPTDPLGPGFWPKGLSYALAMFSVILIVQGLLEKEDSSTEPPIDFKSDGFRRVLKMFGILIVFLVITYFLSIYVGLLFMIPIVMHLLGERNIKIMIPFTLVACVFIFIVFKLLLKVPLPTGLLFS